MTITFNIWVMLFGCGLVIGLFLLVLFLFFRKTRALHFRNVIAALFIMSLMLLDELMQASDIVDRFPYMADFTLTIDLLIWPFFVFYVQALSGKRHGYRVTDLVYFLPFIVGFIWQIPYTFAPGLEKFAYFDNGIPTDMAFFVLFKTMVSFTFLGLIIRTLNTRILQLNERFKGNKKAHLLMNLRKLTTVIFILIGLVYLSFFLNYYNINITGDSDKIGSLLIIATFYFIGIIAFRNPNVFEEDTYSSKIVEFFDGKEPGYAKRLFTFFETENPYLKEKLSIGETAEKLDLTSQQLSYLINQYLGLTFLDFVNSYRVHAVKQALENGEHRSKTLLGLALESGFGNKATFNRIFKNHEGISPSSYVENVRKKVSNPN